MNTIRRTLPPALLIASLAFALWIAAVSFPREAFSQTANFTPWKVDSGYDWVATSTYNISGTSWANSGSTLPGSVAHAQAAQIGSYLYIFGGYNGAAVNTIFRAPVSNPLSWTNTGATLPAATYAAQLAVIGGYVYLFGGNNGSGFVNTIYRASTATPTSWVNTGSVLPVRLAYANIAIIGGYVYIFGGYSPDAGGDTNVIYRASTATPTSWVNTGSTIPAAMRGAQVAVIGSYVYLFGGKSGTTNLNTIYRAPTSNPLSWTNTGATLPSVLESAQVAVIGDYVYLFGGSGAGGATIYRAPVTSPTTWTNIGSLPAPVVYSQVGVVNDTAYLFGGLVSGAYSGAIHNITVTSPGTPTSLSATAGANKVDLTWSAPASNGGSSITNYKIYRDTTAGATTLLTTVGNVLTYSDTTGTPFTTYYYRVKAVNAVGDSQYSNESSAAPIGTPGTPGTPTFSSVTQTTMRVSWTAASNATSYKIERCTGSGCSSFSQIASGVTNTYYDVSGLSGSSSYTYRIRATNLAGDGSYSASASQATLLAPQPPSGTGTAITGWLWSDTIGWVSMNCQTGGSGSSNICATRNYGVAIDGSGNLTGYAWSDNIGWIQFGGLSSFPTGSGTVAQNAYLNTSSLQGWARACAGTSSGDCSTMTSRTDGWDGWIALSGTNFGVSLSGGSFSGYAYGDVSVGWLSWSGTGTYAYSAQTTYLPCAATQNYQCINSNTSQHLAADCSITTDTCTSHGTGWFCSNSNGLCTAPPAPSFGTNSDTSDGTLTAKPTLVRRNATTTLTWTVNNANTCTVTGTNGDSWSGTSSQGANCATHSGISCVSGSITQRSTYTISCTGGGGTLSGSAVVNIIPEFQER